MPSSLDKGFLSENRQPEDMYIKDYERLAEVSEACKKLGLKVGLTQGSFDVKHLGHDRYLMAARKECDVLFVGVDADEKIRSRKGPTRPVVTEDERIEQLCHLRWVHVVTLKKAEYPKHALQKAVHPDVIIISTQTKKGEQVPEYSDEEITELKQYCGDVVVLPPQAPTSTTARIRTLMLDFQKVLQEKLREGVPEFVDRVAADFFGKERG